MNITTKLTKKIFKDIRTTLKDYFKTFLLKLKLQIYYTNYQQTYNNYVYRCLITLYDSISLENEYKNETMNVFL